MASAGPRRRPAGRERPTSRLSAPARSTCPWPRSTRPAATTSLAASQKRDDAVPVATRSPRRPRTSRDGRVETIVGGRRQPASRTCQGRLRPGLLRDTSRFSGTLLPRRMAFPADPFTPTRDSERPPLHPGDSRHPAVSRVRGSHGWITRREWVTGCALPRTISSLISDERAGVFASRSSTDFGPAEILLKSVEHVIHSASLAIVRRRTLQPSPPSTCFTINGSGCHAGPVRLQSRSGCEQP